MPMPQASNQSHKLEKFVLCRARGGLNDTLCQIEKCWRYAENFNRALIIDARHSSFYHDFSKFFQPRKESKKIFFNISNDQLNSLNKLRCFPPEIAGKLDLYLVEFTQGAQNFVVKNTSVQITFDFSKDYDEDVLVHDQCGGGNLSLHLLERLIISSAIRSTILRRINQLDGKYLAVHVRNTDYQTNYKEFFSKILPEVKDKSILVCSDDAAVIQYARSFFTTSKNFLSTKASDPETCSDDQMNSAIDALVDLIAMGRSRKVFFSNVTVGHASGFSRLAQHLSQNKYVIQKLLRIPVSRLPVTKWRLKFWRHSLKRLIP
jgi:hypothetical protein